MRLAVRLLRRIANLRPRIKMWSWCCQQKGIVFIVATRYQPAIFTHVLGEDRAMCCMGCQLASQSIIEAGLEQYYLDRSEINRTASLPDSLYQLQAYDHDDIKSQFIYHQQGHSVAELSINNLRCAA